MTTIIPWPEGVPSCVMPMSPQGGLRDNRLSFETDDAVTPVERPRTSWAPELYQVTMVPMDKAMFQAFQAWFRGPLAYGSLPFVMDHPITREPTVWRIVKGDPPYQVSKVLPMRSDDIRGISVSFGIQSMPLAVPQFSPADFFANGEQGVWYDPSDLRSMFQDAAGTTPAAYGHPVGLILDKSGNGNHAAQATATARPTLMLDSEGRAYLEFDGVDDVLKSSIQVDGIGGPFRASLAAQGMNMDGSTEADAGIRHDKNGANYSGIGLRFYYGYAALVSNVIFRTVTGEDPFYYNTTVSSSVQTVNTDADKLAPHVFSGGFANGQQFVQSDGKPAETRPRASRQTTTGTFQLGATGLHHRIFGALYVIGEGHPEDTTLSHQYMARKIGKAL